MIALGGYIRWACYRALGRLFTFEMSIRDNHELVTDGPYGWVRHPAYTGILLIVAGVILWHATEVCLNSFCYSILEKKKCVVDIDFSELLKNNNIGIMGTRVRGVGDEYGASGCVCVCSVGDYDIRRSDFANGDGGCCVEDDFWSRVGRLGE